MHVRGLRSILLALVLVCLVCSQAFAAGFALYEFSARGNGLGGALIARADDASAVAFNPAGITQLEGTRAMFGVTAIVPSTDVTTVNPYTGESSTTKTEDNVWLPPHAYLTQQLHENYWLGLGVFSRFGLGTEFDKDWPGRYNNYYASIETLSVNPNLVVKVHDTLSLAFGVEAMWIDFNYKTTVDATALLVAGGALPPTTPINDPRTNALDVRQELTGDNIGYGFNAAVFYKPCDWASFGLSYRSQVEHTLDGDAEFDKAPAAAGALPPICFCDTGVKGDVTLPDMYFMGVAFYPTEALSIELDAIFTRWSTYDALTFEYDDPLFVGPAGPVNTITRTKSWDDAWRFQLGVEYVVNDWFELRGGVIFDESPVDDHHVDYLLPANDRMLYSAGTGFNFGSWTLDLSYIFIDIQDRDVDGRVAEGVYDGDFENGDAHLFGASIGYTF